MNCGALDSLCWIRPQQEDEHRHEIPVYVSQGTHSSHDEISVRNMTRESNQIKRKKTFWMRIRKKQVKPFKTTKGSSSDTSDPSVSRDENEELKLLFPSSTVQERNRYLKGRSLDRAAEKMETFMKWRDEYHLFSENVDGIRFGKDDEQLWQSAVSHSAKYYHSATKTARNSDTTYQDINSLPRIVKFGEADDFRASDGKRLLLVLPGLIDKSRASLDFYATCVAVFLYFKLDRYSEESIYVLIDVRAGRNWPNPPPTALIPFVKSLSKLIMLMPERMHQCILFPLPIAAKPVWGLFKPFIDPKVVKKIKILFGPASADSNIPNGMENILADPKVLEPIVQSRLMEFK